MHFSGPLHLTLKGPKQSFGCKNCQNEPLPLTFKGPKQGFGGKNCQNGPLPLNFKGSKQGFGGKNCQNARQGKPCIDKLCLVIAAFPGHPKFYTTTTTTTTTQKDFMWLHNLASAEKHCHRRGKSVANTYLKWFVTYLINRQGIVYYSWEICFKHKGTGGTPTR